MSDSILFIFFNKFYFTIVKTLNILSRRKVFETMRYRHPQK